ncbi:hypothetical protein PBPRA0996 [Photobacterium profundum SS9]|uniref:Uncharacterized protein n=1 Tax=Photobacterium profundum (strain SS9) TaxID=298386 RepID=Q6LTG9_PHOPR|nr:hypothetical protein PBPRA0996 [Photobacterium profundum SS9]
MNKVNNIIHLIFVLLSIIGMNVYSVFRLYGHFSLETLQKQIENDYQIVYIDPTFMISFCSLIIFPLYFLYVINTNVLGKEGGTLVKVLMTAAFLGLFIAVPGQFIEHQRLKNIAINHGYTGCPSFTLLSSTHIVEAMVKNPQFCTDEEINKISMYGYFRELPVVNEYIRSAYGFNE